MRKCAGTGDLFEWTAKEARRNKGRAIKAARIAAFREAVESGKVVDALPVFKARMIRQGAKTAAVRKGDWPERAFWREEPGKIVPIRRQA